jgi:hypothetical protein
LKNLREGIAKDYESKIKIGFEEIEELKKDILMR